MQLVAEIQEFGFLAFHKFRYGDTRPFCDDFCDFVRRNFVTEQA